MQPQTNVKLDKDSFARIKKTAISMLDAKKNQSKNKLYCSCLPREIGLQLTSRCNLRCKHCFEWGDTGFNHCLNSGSSNSELSIELIREILEATKSFSSNLFLWGGEPLIYSNWDALMDLVQQYQRWSVICTNGILIPEKMDSLLKASQYLALLTSIEGFEDSNDLIRGNGTYKKAIYGIREILSLQIKKEFLGKQSVHCTINNNMVGKLYDFALFFEDMGIDTLYLCYPWYIPESVCEKMDTYFEEQWPDRSKDYPRQNRSWRGFSFCVAEELIPKLYQDVEKIIGKKWNIRIRFQPAVEPNEIATFVTGNDITPAQNKTKCLALANRIDILSDGTVSACKLFREFCVGNIYNEPLLKIWTNEEFSKMREAVANEIMPICSKCILLYLNGI